MQSIVVMCRASCVVMATFTAIPQQSSDWPAVDCAVYVTCVQQMRYIHPTSNDNKLFAAATDSIPHAAMRTRDGTAGRTTGVTA